MIQLKVYPNAALNQDESLFLELYETQPIKLTLSIEDITSADATSVFSRTFKVPGTRSNNIFFRNAFEIDGIDFDITVKKPAEILVDGAEFKTGHVRLQKIFVNQEQDKIDYELLFLGETRDFSSAIGELTMCQLDFTDFDWKDAEGNVYLDYDNAAAFTAGIGQQEVRDSWQAFPQTNNATAGYADGDLLFPLIDHGNSYDTDDLVNAPVIALGGPDYDPNYAFTNPDHPLPPSRFKPMIRAKRIWDQIFENSGYTYESNFLFNEQFRHMYVSAFGNQEQVSIGVEQDQGAIFGNASSQTFEYFESDNGNNDIFNFGYFSNQVVAAPNYSVGIPDVQTGGTGSYYEAPGTAALGGAYYAFEFGARVDAQRENSDQGYTALNCNVQLCLVNAPGGNIIEVLATGNTASNGNWSSGTYDSRNGGTQPLAGQYFQVYIECEQTPDVSSVGQAYWQCQAAPGEYSPARDLDCEYQQIDFIKDVITMFRLVMQPSVSRPNHFIIEPWKDFIGSGEVYDWSNKLIREKDFVSEPLFNTQSAQIEFTKQEDEDYINSFHQDNNKHAYGWLRFDSANELLKGKRDIEVIGIAPTPIDQITQLPDPPSGSGATPPVPNPEFILPHIFEVDDNKRLPIKPKTRFLFYNGLVSTEGTTWYYKTGSGAQDKLAYVTYPLVSPYEYWPIENEIGPPVASTLNLNFANDTRYYMDPLPDPTSDPNTYGAIPNTLFEVFWARYISSLYNKYSRRVTAYFTLNNVDLQTLTFDDIIFIDGKYYRPEKIIDAQIGNRTAVKCELISVKDQRVFWPNEPLTNFSITTVDPTCFGSNGSLIITTDGTPPFTWTIAGTGQTGVLTAPVGQAPYIFTIDNIPIGTDQLVVEDTNGRTAIVSFTLAPPVNNPVTSNYVATNATDCGPGPCNGEIAVTVTAGGLPATINWQDGSTSFNRTGLCPGDYLYYVTDSNGCQSDVITVSLGCDQVTTNYILREHLNNCTQSSSATYIASSPLGLANQTTVDLNERNGCYYIQSTTTQAANFTIGNTFTDCADCEGIATNNSYKVEACDFQGSFEYVDRSVTLSKGQVIEIVGVQGCWVVRTLDTTTTTQVVENIFDDCATCQGSVYTYNMTACDDTTFTNVRFNTTTPLQIFGVYKILNGQYAGVCGQVLNAAPPCLACNDVNPTLYDDCNDCLGIQPPAQQRCTTLNNNTFASQTYSYIFNGVTYNNQPIGGGQSVTICAEFGSVTVSDPSVLINVSNTICTSELSCSLFVCQEYVITNTGAIPEGDYKYRDCDGNFQTGTLAFGNSVTICSSRPPKTMVGLEAEATDSICSSPQP